MGPFQAKDIQRIVDIEKYRYSYIATKIGITPEIEEVERTGHTHLYSFRNLLSFAFINQANNMGIGPKACKLLLHFLSNFPDVLETGLYDPKQKTELLLHYAQRKDGKIVKLAGPTISELDQKSVHPLDEFESFRDVERGMATGGNFTINTERLKETIKNLRPDFKKVPLTWDNLEGYTTLNLGKIKDRILAQITE